MPEAAAARSKFYEHVRELRTRMLWCFLALAIGGLVGYFFRNPIINLLQKPLDAPLYYFSPAGSFNFVLKVSFYVGIIFAMPFVIFHVVRFVEPAIQAEIKARALIRLIISSFTLAAIGISFAYYFIVPTSLNFFAKYSSGNVKPLIGAEDYLSFVIACLLTFAIMFQIPLVILFINRIKPIAPKKMMHYQRHMIVAAFLLAVILPFTYDPITQFVIALPIVFLFYASVVLLVIANRKSRKPKPATLAKTKKTQKQPEPVLEPEPRPMPKREPAVAVSSLVRSSPSLTYRTLDLSSFDAKRRT